MSTNKYMRYTNHPVRITCPSGYCSPSFLAPGSGTRAPRYDYRELAQAAIRLDMDIDMEDNHRLYIESAHWIGIPTVPEAAPMKGVDQTGLTYNIYKKVYRKHLKRNSDEQRRQEPVAVLKADFRKAISFSFITERISATRHPCRHLSERQPVSSMPVPVARCQPTG